jgi:F-type H+-transporting ATPase subunit a
MVISNKPLRFLLVALVACVPYMGFANPTTDSVPAVKEAIAEHHATATSHEEKEFNATDLINSHIGDSHEFHLADWGGHPISFYLPVILWTNNGLVSFSSEAFHHDNEGKHIIAVDNQNLVRYKEVIFYADQFAVLTEAERNNGAFADARKALSVAVEYIEDDPAIRELEMGAA